MPVVVIVVVDRFHGERGLCRNAFRQFIAVAVRNRLTVFPLPRIFSLGFLALLLAFLLGQFADSLGDVVEFVRIKLG